MPALTLRTMDVTQALHELGQRLWLDSISRALLRSGTLARYIRDLSVTGLTSNPTIFERAIGTGDSYDAAIRRLDDRGRTTEDLFFELALEDLREAADLLRPAHLASKGLDGWVSLEVSPLLADDAARTILAARDLHDRADRANLFIKIPGTPAGLEAIEEVILDGVPVNVTLLFSREQVLAAAEACLRGTERRLAAGLRTPVPSVLSFFVSRWDRAVQAQVPAQLHNRLGIAVATRTYRAHRDLLASPRWQRLAAAGGGSQRLLWASTGTRDDAAPDTLYVQALAAPDTITTLPEQTLLAFADHGRTPSPLSNSGEDAEAVIAACARAGVGVEALAERLQREGVDAFADSWRSLLAHIRHKRAARAGPGDAVSAATTGASGATPQDERPAARAKGSST